MTPGSLSTLEIVAENERKPRLVVCYRTGDEIWEVSLEKSWESGGPGQSCLWVPRKCHGNWLLRQKDVCIHKESVEEDLCDMLDTGTERKRSR